MISVTGGRRTFMPVGNRGGCRASFIAPEVCTTEARRTRRKTSYALCSLCLCGGYLEAERFHLNSVWKGADGVEDRCGQRLIDLDEGNRVLPRGGAAKVKGRDVDLGGAERVSQRTDKARLVVIAHEQHIAPELCFERDALDRHDARLVAGEQCSGDLARATFTKGSIGRNDHPDQGLIIDRFGAPRFADTDVALPADHRRIDHIECGELR